MDKGRAPTVLGGIREAGKRRLERHCKELCDDKDSSSSSKSCPETFPKTCSIWWKEKKTKCFWYPPSTASCNCKPISLFAYYIIIWYNHFPGKWFSRVQDMWKLTNHFSEKLFSPQPNRCLIHLDFDFHSDFILLYLEHTERCSWKSAWTYSG